MRVASLLFLALAMPAVAAAQANATLGADAQIPQVTLPEAIERANKVQPTVVQRFVQVLCPNAEELPTSAPRRARPLRTTDSNHESPHPV